MELNHINLPVANVATSRDFFARYFGMKTTVEPSRGTVALMRDEGDTLLMLSQFDKSAEINYHTDFPIGFNLETRAEVDDIRASMNSDGLYVELPKARKGRFGFYLHAPGGFTTEIGVLEGTGGPLDREALL